MGEDINEEAFTSSRGFCTTGGSPGSSDGSRGDAVSSASQPSVLDRLDTTSIGGIGDEDPGDFSGSQQIDVWEQRLDLQRQSAITLDSNDESPILKEWTYFTSTVHNLISHAVVTLSRYAAIYPKTVITIVTVVAFVLVPVGYFTNFSLAVEQEDILAPFNSLSRKHFDWIKQESGFPESTRPFDLLVHQEGDNVLTVNTMRRVFEALQLFQETPGYATICAQGVYDTAPGTGQRKTCRIHAATRFWWHNVTLFDEQVTTDETLKEILSADEYPLGTPVGDHDFILGNYEVVPISNFSEGFSRWNTTNNDTTSSISNFNDSLLVSAQSYIIRIDLPVIDIETSAFEDLATEEMLNLRREWEDDPTNPVRLELFTFRSIPNEFMRAIVLDVPLYPAVFFIMVGFSCLVFYRRDPVHSRCLLGIGSVCTIGLSLLTGVGLMSIVGVPLTNLTGSLAFVVFGVGLDDTFIIMGHYSRTDPKKDPVVRICETMENIGLSIFVTTLTTMLAFGLGTMSAVPAIRWLCLYALPTIFIDFLYQITFFVALVVLDEMRIGNNRRDCFFWVTVQKEVPGKEDALHDSNQEVKEEESGLDRRESNELVNSLEHVGSPKSFAETFMAHYTNILLLPAVKALVLLGFTIFLGFAMYSATLLEQEFKAEEIVPEDSYVKGFLHGVNTYSVQVIAVGAYFRDVDQSDSQIQTQMLDYVSELAELEQIGEEPPFCWIRDFQQIREHYRDISSAFENLTFTQQFDVALSIPTIREVYGPDIVRDDSGNITASRCWLFMKNLDMQSVQAQTDMLLDQRAISRNHIMNQQRPRFAFFSFDIWYIIWEFYTVAINELILTTIAGICSVSIVSFLFIPHWTGVLFISPLITALYIDLLGAMQFAGVNINVVTYVCLVISVGLLVDFIMHILLKYYESFGRTREEKVRDILETMGPSVLVGGLSTLLGVLPLAFSTNEVNRIVFTSFIAMVSFGLGHGIVLLPVILSLVGPTNFSPRVHHRRQKEVAKDLPSVNESAQAEDAPPTNADPNEKRLRKYTSDTHSVRLSCHESVPEEAKVEEVYEEQERHLPSC